MSEAVYFTISGIFAILHTIILITMVYKTKNMLEFKCFLAGKPVDYPDFIFEMFMGILFIAGASSLWPISLIILFIMIPLYFIRLKNQIQNQIKEEK